MPKHKHDRALLTIWLASARKGDVTLVSESIRDAQSLRNALYHLQRDSALAIRIERKGRMLTLRAMRGDATAYVVNARAAKLTRTRTL